MSLSGGEPRVGNVAATILDDNRQRRRIDRPPAFYDTRGEIRHSTGLWKETMGWMMVVMLITTAVWEREVCGTVVMRISVGFLRLH